MIASVATKKKEPKKKANGAEGEKTIISAPLFQLVELPIVGITPLCTNRFANKAAIMAKQEEGSTANSKKSRSRDAKDFEALGEAAKYRDAAGWCGFPSHAIRCAAISACRLVNYKMTLAKLSIFVECDGYDVVDGIPITRIYGEPIIRTHAVRNATGVIDIRARPFFDPGWKSTLRIRFDSEQFRVKDIANLVMRIGAQIGIGEGRADSKNSAGQGWGMFEIVTG